MGILGNGLSFTAIGVALGLVGAFATSRLLETLLFGVSRVDPVTYAAVIMLLVVVAAVACWAPANRAAAADPADTLRAQ
jgi:putative ABC transport system permease protein